MSSHLHLGVKANEGYELSNILRDFKKFTAKQILNEIEFGGYESRREWLLHRFEYRGKISKSNRQYQFWQADNHPIVLYNLPVITQKIDYIHANPVKEGWVSSGQDYTYSSASNYMKNEGVLSVTVIDSPSHWVGYVSYYT